MKTEKKKHKKARLYTSSSEHKANTLPHSSFRACMYVCIMCMCVTHYEEVKDFALGERYMLSATAAIKIRDRRESTRADLPRLSFCSPINVR
jgi:hypothetical protein